MMEKKFYRIARERGETRRKIDWRAVGNGEFVHTDRKERFNGSRARRATLRKKVYGDRRDEFGISHEQDQRIIKNRYHTCLCCQDIIAQFTTFASCINPRIVNVLDSE